MHPMEKLWSKFRSKSSSRSPSRSTERHFANSNSQADTDSHAIPAITSPLAITPITTAMPSQSRGQHQQPLSSSSPSAGSARGASTSADQDRSNAPEANTSTSSENTSGWKTTTYSGVKMGLEVVRESSDMFLPLKSAAAGLSALLKHYDQFIANKDDVQRLIDRIDLLTTSFTGPPPDSDIDEIERRRILKSKLKKVLDTTLNPMLNQSNFFGFMNNADQAGVITSVVEDIRDAIIDYQTSLQQGLNQNTVTTKESVLLDKLPRAKGAGYDSGDENRCLRGTRVEVLEAIEDWVKSTGDRRVYWLNGIAGTGKTTIAKSFAAWLFEESLLGASFFCSRDFLDRRNLHSIFPTLAFQLAYKYPKFRAHLVPTLTANPDIGHESLSNQLNKLLVEPLQFTGLSAVIVIDALDECEDSQPASAILSLLSREIDHIPSVKFFITGRPESRIRKGFRLSGLHPRTEVLLLHEIERGNVDEDIKLYLEHHFKEIVKNRSDVNIATPWPTPQDIGIVTIKAGGLFIYASTVIKFVDSETDNPQDRLLMITSMPHSSVYEGQSGIDTMYTCVFEKGCAHVHSSDASFFSRVLIIVSSVVLLYEPISVGDLAKLLDIADSTNIFTPIRPLHSVLLVPDSDSEPIRVFHKSFPDYITDQKRCTDSRFYVDSSVHHARLAIRCFELMETRLKKNICNLSQYAMNDDIEDLSVRRHECIGEALVYACRFWAKHLCSTSQTGENVAQIMELLRKFVQRHLLQWLEVLSITKDLRGGIHSLIDVERWVANVRTPDEGLLNLIYECRRFVLYTFDVIEQSAVHIYDSALLWVPTSSLIRTLYHDQLTTEVRVLNGIDISWDSCIRSIRLGDAKTVWSTAFSHRGNLIAGCNGSVIKVLESTTGVCLATLNGLDEEVRSIVFSPDDTILASGSKDYTVKVWDVQTGVLIKTLTGHTSVVSSVAFSPTGTMVASGAEDGTIRIWNMSSWDCHCILEGHSGGVTSVCWLRVSEVMSGGWDKKVKMWDVSNGECLKTFGEHSYAVYCVASSPDASKIASGSFDGTVKVYDTLTGVVQTVAADKWATSICFSPSGNQIVYGTDTLVVVWDLEKKVATFRQQLYSNSVVWSPDGSCIAVGSSDGFIRVFQLGIGTEDGGVHDQHSKNVLCVSSSADGRMIASGSAECSVKVWDAMTGSCIHTFRGHGDLVRSVTFSPDSSLLASGHLLGTIWIWGLHDHELITTLTDSEQNTSATGIYAPIAIRFSPNGKRMVSVSLPLITLWDVEEWGMLARVHLSGNGPGSRVSFSADGTRVILGSRDATVNIWNILPNAEYDPSKNSSLPMNLVPIQEAILYKDIEPYRYPERSEWIIDQDGRHVCWIPADLRECSNIHGKMVALGTTDGKFITIDLSKVC